MDLQRLIDRIDGIKDWVRFQIHVAVARLAYLAPYTMSTSDGIEDGISGRPDDDEPESQRSARRVQHAGFRSRPLVQSQAVAISVEGGDTKTVIVAEDDGLTVTLDDGEAKVYSPKEPTCRIHFDKNGKMYINAKSGQDIVFNDGTAKVNREGDSVSQGAALKTWMDAVTTATSVPPFVGTTIGATGSGASNVKA